MWLEKHEMEIKDAIRTLAKEFYKNPSGFTSRADFKERFYKICVGKRPFKKRYKLFPLTGEKLSVVRKDCPIYFAKKEEVAKVLWSYDIAILSPDLITRFMFDNPWHMSILQNDAVGLVAAIEFVFITENFERVQRDVENCYAKLDAAHRLAQKYIVAFSNSHEGNERYFERTINDPGSPCEPRIICISVQQDESGNKSIEYDQHPFPWITTSKFKDRMERLNFYLSRKPVGGRQKKPGFVARHLSKYLFGESRW